MILSDLGARVLKIEMPGTGDEARQVGPFVDGNSLYFASVNRGKESLAIDLKTKEGIDLVLQLARKADILTENFRPGTMEKLGLGYTRLSEMNPSLIYTSLSGFGQTGPYSGRGAYDIVIQAMGGIMSVTGQENGQPTRAGISVGDLIPALYTTVAIEAALHARSNSGKGTYLDISMMDSMVAVAENAMARYWVTGKAPVPMGSRHPTITPFDAYQVADGFIVVGAGNNSLFEKLCKVLGRLDLIGDPRMISNKERNENASFLTNELSKAFVNKDAATWLAQLEKEGIPAAKVNSMADLASNEQVAHRRMLVDIEQPGIGRMKVPGSPIRAMGYDNSVERPAPAVGEHTVSVLAGVLGLTVEEIDGLAKKGAIAPMVKNRV